MIRTYTPADWAEVCRIFDAAKPVELATANIAHSFVPLASDEKRKAEFSRATVFVDAEGSDLRGFIGFEHSYIGWLFVDPIHFRIGTARMLRHALGVIPPPPWLWVAKGNTPAMALYRAEGFAVVQERESQNHGHACTVFRMALVPKLPNRVPGSD